WRYQVSLQVDTREITWVKPQFLSGQIMFQERSQKQRSLQLTQGLYHLQPSNANSSQMNQLLNRDVGQNGREQLVRQVVQLLGLGLRSRLPKKVKFKIKELFSSNTKDTHLVLLGLVLEWCNLEHSKTKR